MKFVRQQASTAHGFTLALALLVVVFFVAVGFGPNTLPYSPWQESPRLPNGQQMPTGWPFSDAVISHWPNALFLQRALQTSTWPQWRALLMSGQPFSANPLNKVWYPPQWLVAVLPVTLHLNLLIAGHLVLAGLGMRVLGRSLGFSPTISVIMGLAYAFTPRLAAAIGAGHLDIVYAAAWLPWMLWAIHGVIAGDAPAVRRGTVLGMIAALCFLADIRLSLPIFAMTALWGAWLWWQCAPGQRQRVWLAIVVAGLIGVGLTAVQWLPLMALTPYLSRAGLTTQEAGIYSLQPVALIGLLWPYRGGLHETMVYAGVVVLLLAIRGFVAAPRRHLIWALMALGGMFYAFGTESFFWPLAVRLLPPLLWFRVPSRAWIIVIACLVVMAGYGLEILLRPVRRERSVFGVVLLGSGIAIGVVSALLPMRPGAGLAATVGILGLGVLWIARRWLRAPQLAGLSALLIVLDLVWMNISLTAGLSRQIWLDAYQPLAQALLDAHVTRVYSPDYSLPQEAAAYWQIPDLGGVDPFQLRSYVTAFEKFTSIPTEGYTVTLPSYNGSDILTANRNAPFQAEALATWNVSHVVARFKIEAPGLRLVNHINDVYLYENTLRPTGLHLEWAGPNRFTAENSGQRPVNIASWAPGWNVPDQDGAITILPGQHLSGEYSAPGLWPGLIISGVSLIASGVCIVATRRRTPGAPSHFQA